MVEAVVPVQAESILGRMWNSRTLRFLLLGPNALTFLMQFEDVSEILRKSLRFWLPIYDLMIRWGEFFVVPSLAPAFVMSVLFVPFAISGSYDIITRHRWTVTIATAAIAMMMYVVVLISGSGGSLSDMLRYSSYWWFLAVAATIAATGTSVSWLISRPFVRSLLLIHIGAVVVFFMIAFVVITFMTARSPPLIGIVFGALMLCPLLNMRRLRDLGLIVGGLLLAFIFGDFLSAL